MESGDHLAVAQSERGGEGTVDAGESRDRRAIASGGGGKVGNDVNSFISIDMVGGVLVNMIGGLVAGNRGGGLRLAQFLMEGGKKGFKLGPVLFGWVPSFPQLATVIE